MRELFGDELIWRWRCTDLEDEAELNGSKLRCRRHPFVPLFSFLPAGRVLSATQAFHCRDCISTLNFKS